MSYNIEFLTISLYTFITHHVVHLGFTCFAQSFLLYFLSIETLFIIYIFIGSNQGFKVVCNYPTILYH